MGLISRVSSRTYRLILNLYFRFKKNGFPQPTPPTPTNPAKTNAKSPHGPRSPKMPNRNGRYPPQKHGHVAPNLWLRLCLLTTFFLYYRYNRVERKGEYYKYVDLKEINQYMMHQYGVFSKDHTEWQKANIKRAAEKAAAGDDEEDDE